MSVSRLRNGKYSFVAGKFFALDRGSVEHQTHRIYFNVLGWNLGTSFWKLIPIPLLTLLWNYLLLCGLLQSSQSQSSFYARNFCGCDKIVTINSLQIVLTASSTPIEQSKQLPCLDYKKSFNIFTKGVNGWNTNLHKFCLDSYRTRRRRRRQRATSASPTIV